MGTEECFAPFTWLFEALLDATRSKVKTVVDANLNNLQRLSFNASERWGAKHSSVATIWFFLYKTKQNNVRQKKKQKRTKEKKRKENKTKQNKTKTKTKTKTETKHKQNLKIKQKHNRKQNETNNN